MQAGKNGILRLCLENGASQMNGTIEIEELRKEVEEARVNLTRKEAMLEMAISYLEEKSARTTRYNHVKNTHTYIKLPAVGDDRPLSTKVKDIIPQFHGKPFTRADIETAMRGMGMEIDFPTSRITTELIKLEGESVECTQRGTGRALSYYKEIQD